MRDLIRKRILDWHYTGRGSLNEIVDDLLPSHYLRYRWSIYHCPDGQPLRHPLRQSKDAHRQGGRLAAR